MSRSIGTPLRGIEGRRAAAEQMMKERREAAARSSGGLRGVAREMRMQMLEKVADSFEGSAERLDLRDDLDNRPWYAELTEREREAELARKVRERTEAKRAMKAMQEREAADAEASRQVAKRTGVMAGEIRLKPYFGHYLTSVDANARGKDVQAMEQHKSTGVVDCRVLFEEECGQLLHVLYLEGPAKGVEQHVPVSWVPEYGLRAFAQMCCRCESLGVENPQVATEINGMCWHHANPEDEDVERTAQRVEQMELAPLPESEEPASKRLDMRGGELQRLAFSSSRDVPLRKAFRWRANAHKVPPLEAAQKRLLVAALSLFFDFTKIIWPAAARVEWVTTKMAHECDPTPAVLGDWDVVKRVATLVSTPFSGKHWPRSCTATACIPVAAPTKAPVATKPEASVDAETARRLRELGLDVSSVLDPRAKFEARKAQARQHEAQRKQQYRTRRGPAPARRFS